MKNAYSEDEKRLLLSLGNRIKQFRQVANLSQEQLAFECGLDRTYIGSVERGKRNISLINLTKIAKSLKNQPSELIKFE